MVAQLWVNFLYNDDILKELPSKKKYASFHNSDVDCEDAYFYQHAIRPLQNEEWQKDISQEIRNALCYIYNKNKNGDVNIDDCDYLYYWLNDIIYRNITFQLYSKSVMGVLNFLLQNNDGLNICYNNIYDIDKDNFRDIKLLFDFSKDYDKLNEYFSNGHKFCSSDSQKYVNQYIIKYNEIKGKCNDENSMDATCIAFKKFFAGRKIVDLRNWTCNSRTNTGRLASREGNHENQIEHSEPDVVNRVAKKEKLQHETIRTGEENAFTGSNFINSDVYIGPSALSPNIDSLNNSSAFTDSKVMTIASLVIGITVFFILFYKFTPFGYWVKKVLLGKSKRKHNIIMDRNIIEDYTIPQDLGSRGRFNVTYSNIL